MFRSVIDLQVTINRFVAETNLNPKPFVWAADPKRVLTGEANPLDEPERLAAILRDRASLQPQAKAKIRTHATSIVIDAFVSESRGYVLIASRPERQNRYTVSCVLHRHALATEPAVSRSITVASFSALTTVRTTIGASRPRTVISCLGNSSSISLAV